MTTLSKNTKDFTVLKDFRQSRIFLMQKDLWGGLVGGEGKINFEDLEDLRGDIAYRQYCLDKGKSLDKKKDKKIRNALIYVERYLWDRLKREAAHINEAEQNLLIKTAKDHFDVPEIAAFCIALLKQDQPYLIDTNYRAFLTTMLGSGSDCSHIVPIYTRLHPQMFITRQVCAALPYDRVKDLDQTARKALAKGMFQRTSVHLHELAHGPEFEGCAIEESLGMPLRFTLHKHSEKNLAVKLIIQRMDCGIPTREDHEFIRGFIETHIWDIIKVPTLHKEEFAEFKSRHIGDFYRHAHKEFLPTAIRLILSFCVFLKCWYWCFKKLDFKRRSSSCS